MGFGGVEGAVGVGVTGASEDDTSHRFGAWIMEPFLPKENVLLGQMGVRIPL